MDDLVAFLNERLGELENSGKPDRHTVFCGHDQIEFGDECKCGIPAFVLADVAAKRQIIAEHQPALKIVQWWDDQTGKGEALVCSRCQNAENDDDRWHPAIGEAGEMPWENFVTAYVLAPCRTLRLLALPFAGHPAYREGWKP